MSEKLIALDARALQPWQLDEAQGKLERLRGPLASDPYIHGAKQSEVP